MLNVSYSHWPDCNWCSKGSAHFANPNATQGDPSDGAGSNPYHDPKDDNPDVDPGDFNDAPDDWSTQDDDGSDVAASETVTVTETQTVLMQPSSAPMGKRFSSHFRSLRGVHSNDMRRVHRKRTVYSLDLPLPDVLPRQWETPGEPIDAESDVDPSVMDNLPTPTLPLPVQLPSLGAPQLPSLGVPQPTLPVAAPLPTLPVGAPVPSLPAGAPLPTLPVGAPPLPVAPGQQTTTTANRVAGTGTPAEAPAKGACTPSPTKSLAPSASE